MNLLYVTALNTCLWFKKDQTFGISFVSYNRTKVSQVSKCQRRLHCTFFTWHFIRSLARHDSLNFRWNQKLKFVLQHNYLCACIIETETVWQQNARIDNNFPRHAGRGWTSTVKLRSYFSMKLYDNRILNRSSAAAVQQPTI